MAIVDGGAGNDPLYGGLDDDLVRGFAGNDTLYGGSAGYDTLEGGDDNDVVYVDLGDEGYGGNGNDFMAITNHDVVAIDGGAGDDTLRAQGGFDLTSTSISGIEQFNAYYGVSLTTAQLGAFQRISGYDAGYTSASVNLTRGGTATVNLMNSLTSYFQIFGSQKNEDLTIINTFLHTVDARLGSGDDRIVSSSGNDNLLGERGNDTLYGNDGNDTMSGGVGTNRVFGGDGNDVLWIDGFDSAVGGAGNDLVAVRFNAPIELNGGIGDDTLRFESDYDITGTVISQFENLFIYGTPRMTADQLGTFLNVGGYNPTYSSASLLLTAGGTANVAILPTLLGFNVTGSAEADILSFTAGSPSAITVGGRHGNDSLSTGAGNDFLYGDTGLDTLNGRNGNDLLDGGANADILFGGNGNDVLLMRSGDSLYGGSNDDLIRVTESYGSLADGGTGNDTLRFDNSYDITGMALVGIEQANLYGTDLMTAAQLASFAILSGYDGGYSSATVVLTEGGTATNLTFSATLSGVLDLTGSGQADILGLAQGGVTRVNVNGGFGNDSLTGGSGNDTMRGAEGNDTLIGMNGNDSLDGGIGSDRLDGGNGNDTLVASAGDTVIGGGNDDLIQVVQDAVVSINGGGGNDTLQTTGGYDLTGVAVTGVETLFGANGTMLTATQLNAFSLVAGAPGNTSTTLYLTEGGTASITLDLSLSNSFSLYGSDQNDEISVSASYPNRIYFYGGHGHDEILGAQGGDSLQGDFGRDTLSGRDGNDSLYGGIGRDKIIGGNGADSLYGGANQDTFTFRATTESTSANPDIIQDFEGAGTAKGDVIDLAAIDANVSTGIDDAFTFGSVAKGGVSLIDNGFGQTEVRLNTDNDAAFEMVFVIADGAVAAAAYTVNDFLL